MDDAVDEAPRKSAAQGILRTLSSPFTGERGRWNLANLAGRTFRGARDAYDALGYKRVLFSRDYRARYMRGGVSARIVEAMPQACWRGGADIADDEDPDKETPFEKAFEKLDRRLHVWQMFERADILAGLGRYAILVIGGPGADMQEPLTKCSLDQIRYLRPYAEDDAFITRYDMDKMSDRFGQPELYALRRMYIQWPGQMNPPQLPAMPVHWSRVIHIADKLRDDNVFGIPRLQQVWNLLDDLDKVIGGGAEAFWKRADGGTTWEIDKDLVFDPDEKKAEAQKKEMQKKVQDFTDNLEKNIIMRGMKASRLGSDTADLRGPAGAIMDQISATIGMPQRILMGSEMGKLASSKDKSNWDDQVQDRRDSFCFPVVIQQFIDRLIELGALPPPQNDTYDANWPSTDEMDQGQRVTAAVQISTLNKNEGTPVVTPSEIRTVYLGLEPMTTEQLKEVDDIKAEKIAMQQKIAGQSPGGPQDGEVVPGAPPSTDDKASLAVANLDVRALEEALLDDNLELADAIVLAALEAVV